MRRRKKYSLIAIPAVTVFFSLFLLLSPAAAEGRVINEDINKAVGDLEIPVGTTVNGDVTLNIGELTVLGKVNGNVNSNMGQVTVDGDVSGNIETNMGRVVVGGNVGGSVKTRMGEVVIDGSVAGDLSSGLGASTVGGSVGGNIDSGFGELLVDGSVAGNIYSRGGKVVINGIVEGDVTLDQGLLELGPGSVVSGRVYVARGQVRKAETAAAGPVEVGEELDPGEIGVEDDGPGYRFDGVDGDFVDSVIDRVTRGVNRGLRGVGLAPRITGEWDIFRFPFLPFYGSAARGVINMLIMFALAALTYTLFPRQSRAAGEAVSTRTGPVIGWGLLAVVLAVPLMVILAVTIIGIPLIIVVVAALAAAAVLGYTGIVNLIGEKVIGAAASRPANPLGAIAIGVLILGLIAMIPLVGGLVSLAILTLALGVSLVTRFGSQNHRAEGPAEPGTAEYSPEEAGTTGLEAAPGVGQPTGEGEELKEQDGRARPEAGEDGRANMEEDPR